MLSFWKDRVLLGYQEYPFLNNLTLFSLPCHESSNPDPVGGFWTWSTGLYIFGPLKILSLKEVLLHCCKAKFIDIFLKKNFKVNKEDTNLKQP